jgi:hypothetical protein
VYIDKASYVSESTHCQTLVGGKDVSVVSTYGAQNSAAADLLESTFGDAYNRTAVCKVQLDTRILVLCGYSVLLCRGDASLFVRAAGM